MTARISILDEPSISLPSKRVFQGTGWRSSVAAATRPNMRRRATMVYDRPGAGHAWISNAVIERYAGPGQPRYIRMKTLVDKVSYMTRVKSIKALRIYMMGQQAVISKLQAADRKSQTQMAEFQRQLRPAKGSAQPDAPGEAGSSS
ncbi:hypothetical protein Tco_0046321 [Tanacetum coccineum]